MKLIINKDRSVIPVGTWGTKNENDFEIVDFEFPEELEGYNKRIVYLLGGGNNPWDVIIDNKAYITNEITSKENVKGYVWCTKGNPDRPADTDFRSQEFDIPFYKNENATGVVPTPQQVDGFNTMLTAMNAKIDEVDALEQTIGAAESQRQEAEATRVSNENTRESNESTRQTNEETRQTQEAERERRTDEAIADIKDKTAEYNANAEEKTNEFNDLVETQKLVIENYADTQLNAIGKKGKQALSSITTTTQYALQNISLAQQTGVSAVETASSEATTNFNTNATNKTNAFNSNATEKTTAFDNNASTKTSEFNTNAESKTSAFNDNATSKTNDFNDNATEKTDEFNTNAQNKIDEYDEHIADYQAQIDELQEEVEELSENMPWNTTEQATEISVDDAAKYSKNKLELFGNTEQAENPSPDHPQPIHVVTGNNTISIGSTDYPIDLRGKNLFNPQKVTPNTYLQNSGNTGESQASNLADYIMVKASQVYTISFKYDEIFNQGNRSLCFYNTQKRYISGRYIDITKTITVTPARDGYIRFAFDKNWYDIQVEEGTETSYEPYNPLELCKIGDYQDYFYKENGNWYKYGAINRLIITENANVYTIPYGTNSYGMYVPESSFIKVINNKTMVLSNKYKGIAYNDRTNEISNSIYEADRQDVLNFRNTNFVTADDFKQNNIGTILYVVLQTPTTTQITNETLIAQLDAIYEHLQLVKGTNNITVTAEDLAPYMELSYMQDIKSN